MPMDEKENMMKTAKFQACQGCMQKCSAQVRCFERFLLALKGIQDRAKKNQ